VRLIRHPQALATATAGEDEGRGKGKGMMERRRKRTATDTSQEIQRILRERSQAAEQGGHALLDDATAVLDAPRKHVFEHLPPLASLDQEPLHAWSSIKQRREAETPHLSPISHLPLPRPAKKKKNKDDNTSTTIIPNQNLQRKGRMRGRETMGALTAGNHMRTCAATRLIA
jgi:hypothetical protein